jgi:hypothetical protein
MLLAPSISFFFILSRDMWRSLKIMKVGITGCKVHHLYSNPKRTQSITNWICFRLQWNGGELFTDLVAGSLNNLCPLTVSILTPYSKRSRWFIVNVNPAVLVITIYDRVLCWRRFEGTCLNFCFRVLSLYSNFYPEHRGRNLLRRVSNSVDTDVV